MLYRPSHIILMSNYRYISREIKEAAFKMSQEGLSDEQIEQFLGIGGRTMRRLRATYHATGAVVQIQACPGRPRLLDGLDARVRLFPFIFRLYN